MPLRIGAPNRSIQHPVLHDVVVELERQGDWRRIRERKRSASCRRERIRFTYSMGPGWSGTSAAIEQRPDREHAIIRRRIEVVRENMQRTIEGIKASAESS
ncbi:MAG: hypothetical protein QOJ66_3120 [Ilumatobacteraceae bacterium]|jgi:adenylate kinase family enzyme